MDKDAEGPENTNRGKWTGPVTEFSRKYKFNPIMRNPEVLSNTFCDLGIVFIFAARKSMTSVFGTWK